MGKLRCIPCLEAVALDREHALQCLVWSPVNSYLLLVHGFDEEITQFMDENVAFHGVPPTSSSGNISLRPLLKLCHDCACTARVGLHQTCALSVYPVVHLPIPSPAYFVFSLLEFFTAKKASPTKKQHVALTTGELAPATMSSSSMRLFLVLPVLCSCRSCFYEISVFNRRLS